MKKFLMLIFILIISLSSFSFKIETGISQGIFPSIGGKIDLPFGLYLGVTYTNTVIPYDPDDNSIIFKKWVDGLNNQYYFLLPILYQVGISADIIKLAGLTLNLQAGGEVTFFKNLQNQDIIIPGCDFKISLLKDINYYKIGLYGGLSAFYYTVRDFEDTKTFDQYLIVPQFGLSFQF